MRSPSNEIPCLRKLCVPQISFAVATWVFEGMLHVAGKERSQNQVRHYPCQPVQAGLIISNRAGNRIYRRSEIHTVGPVSFVQ